MTINQFEMSNGFTCENDFFSDQEFRCLADEIKSTLGHSTPLYHLTYIDLDLYNDPIFIARLAKIIGTKIQVIPSYDINKAWILTYTKNFKSNTLSNPERLHADVRRYNCRQFRVIIPLTNSETQLYYKARNKYDVVKYQQRSLIILENGRLFHRVAPVVDELRMLLVMDYIEEKEHVSKRYIQYYYLQYAHYGKSKILLGSR